jgi:hypothetical protein
MLAGEIGTATKTQELIRTWIDKPLSKRPSPACESAWNGARGHRRSGEAAAVAGEVTQD